MYADHEVKVTEQAIQHVGQQVAKIVSNKAEETFGCRYTTAEKEMLDLLKNYYLQSLELSTAPATWNLKPNREPTHHYRFYNWKEVIHTHINGKDKTHELRDYAQRFATFAADYLTIRRERLLRSGKPGDLAEQFFAELIDWSIKDLASFSLNEEALQIISKRLTYLRRVKTDPNIMHSTIWGDEIFNHENILNEMIKTLDEAHQFVKIHAPKQAVIDLLRDMEKQCSNILIEFANWLYKFNDCQTAGRCDFYDFTNSKPNKFNCKILKTSSGQLLFEFIIMIGPQALNLPTEFIVDKFQCKLITTELSTVNIKIIGAPIFLTQPHQIQLYKQAVSICLLLTQLRDLHRLLGFAREVAIGEGENWACVKESGRQALRALIQSINSVAQQFSQQFSELCSATQRSSEEFYVHGRKKTTYCYQNYSDSHRSSSDLLRFTQQLETTCTKLSHRIDFFHDVGQYETLRKEAQLYVDLVSYLQSHHPSSLANFSQLQTIAQTINQTREQSLITTTNPPVEIISISNLGGDKSENIQYNLDEILNFHKTAAAKRTLTWQEFHAIRGMISQNGTSVQKLQLHNYFESCGIDLTVFAKLSFRVKKPVWLYKGLAIRQQLFFLIFQYKPVIDESLINSQDPVKIANGCKILKELLLALTNLKKSTWPILHWSTRSLIDNTKTMFLKTQQQLILYSSRLTEPTYCKKSTPHDEASTKVITPIEKSLLPKTQDTPDLLSVSMIFNQWLKALEEKRFQKKEFLPLNLHYQELQLFISRRLKSHDSVSDQQHRQFIKSLQHDLRHSQSTVYQKQVALLTLSLEMNDDTSQNWLVLQRLWHEYEQSLTRQQNSKKLNVQSITKTFPQTMSRLFHPKMSSQAPVQPHLHVTSQYIY